MKKYIIASVLALSALSIASCVNELAEVEQSPSETKGVYMTFDASPAENDNTKTNLVNEDGVYKFPWTVGDAISLFYGSGTNGGSKFTSNATEQTSITKFSGIIDVITGGDEDSTDDTSFWAIYPYNENNSCDGESLTFTLASEQTAVAEGIKPNTCPTIAKASGLHLGFYQTCGYIRFTVSQPGIKQVIFTNASGAPIAGTMTYSFDDNGKPVFENISGSDRITVNAPNNGTFATGTNYYVIVAPVAISDGLFITYMTETMQGTYKTAAFSVERKVGNTLLNKDSGRVYELRDYCLTFSMESGSNTLSLDNKADYGDPNQPNVQYSYDKIVWKNWNYSALEFSEDRPLYIRGENSETGFSHMDDETQDIVYSTFKFSAPGASVDGNIMSLVSYGYVWEEICWVNCFYALFRGAPIVKGPELPAMDLSADCYAEMFSGCTLLEEAPELPADGLSSGCYAFMFSGCTSLTKAPVLPAEYLAEQCYHFMFKGCSNLNYVEAYFTDWDQKGRGKPWTDCTNNWLSGVAETGTFVKNHEAEWDIISGPSGIPAGWMVVDDNENVEISLNKDFFIIATGGFEQISATTYPEGLEVTFESSNEDVAFVSNGWVYGGKDGEATITATACGKSTTCLVKVYAEMVQFWDDGPYWYGYNIGASSPEQSGNYFYWGGSIGYHKDIYGYWVDNNNNQHSFYVGDYPADILSQATELATTQDAAYKILGMDKRIPSVEEYKLLLRNTQQEYIADYYGTGVPGVLVKNERGSIFFPYAGRAEMNNNLVYEGGNSGRPIMAYWTRSVAADSLVPWEHKYDKAYIFSENDTNVCYKYYGLPIRAIYEPHIFQ